MIKLRGLFLSAAVLAPMTISSISAFAAETDTAESKVLAEVVSGGMELVAKDANFGALTIGIEPGKVEVPKLLTVTDHTGGAGFSINVKATNYADTEKTMTTSAHISRDVALTDTASEIVTGESKLAPQTFDGEISGSWGVAPKAGEFTQNLLWTMTATAAPVDNNNADLADMMNGLELTGSFASTNTYDESGSILGSVEVTSDGTVTSAANAGENSYEVVKNISLRDMDSESLEGSGKDRAKGLILLNGDFAFTPTNGKPANEVISSVDAPAGINAEVTASGISFTIDAGGYRAPFTDESKTKTETVFTLHLADGTTGTLKLVMNTTWI